MKKTPVIFLALLVLSILVGACAAPAAQTTQAPAATQAVQPTQPPVATAAPQKTEEPAATEEPMAESMVMLPEVNPLEVTGAIVTAGSSTVFPLAEAMATRFKDEGYADQITIDSIGSGAGIERFCVTGETDIANASRAIKDSEIESCKAINRNPIEFRVGTDALAVVVSKENTFLTNATFEQLALIFSTAEKWSDVDPSWPAETIVRYIPGTDSGTFDYFVEAVFDSNKEPILAAQNNNLSEDDNVLVQGVQGSPYAIGFFGYAYYEENADSLNILSIEGVTPSFETVESAEYPLARPLFIYSDGAIMQSKPQVAAFINFFLTYVNEEIEQVGYFPASVAALDGAKQAWLDGMAVEVSMEPMGVMLPEVNPLEVTGAIVTAGSSTVFPLAEAMATRFKDEGYADQITIASIGSGAGIERFCVTGETDIANASRAIKDSEIESCKAINRNPIEFRVGTDALAVVVAKENTFLTNATFEQLALIFSTAEKWSDVDPSWPAETIVRYIPGTDSGTFDYFVEAVFDSNKEPILAAQNNNLSEDDNVLVQGVQGSPFAIGFFGYAYYEENADSLNILSIEGVTPSFETVESAEYPLARPLFIYSDATIMQEKPQVAAFINFFLTYVNEEIEQVGYFPASVAALDAARQGWLDGMK